MADSTPSSPPPARGVRLDWSALPPSVRASVEVQLGSPVVEARTQHGGFSPGVAARLVTADGHRAFAKAVDGHRNAESPAFHRREAHIVSRMPPTAPVPRLLWSSEGEPDGWEVLLFEDIEGVQPREPWIPAELDRVIAAIIELNASLTPSPVSRTDAGAVEDWGLFRGNYWARLNEGFQAGIDKWTRRNAFHLAAFEARAPEASTGDTLLHLDLRADNMLLTPERVWVVDWPHARIGAAWLDMVLLAPSVTMQGGPEPEELLRAHPAARAAKPDDITAAVTAMTGFFTLHALLPPPPGLPTVRAFQAAQGQVARRWLAERTGLE